LAVADGMAGLVAESIGVTWPGSTLLNPNPNASVGIADGMPELAGGSITGVTNDGSRLVIGVTREGSMPCIEAIIKLLFN
jgi:hypothetical protein